MPAAHALRLVYCCLLLAGCCWLAPAVGADPQPLPPKGKGDAKAKEIAGKSEFLRSVPKHYAILKGVDVARRRVTLWIEGDSLPKVWQLTPDAEIKVVGWWGGSTSWPWATASGPGSTPIGQSSRSASSCSATS